MNPQQPQQPPQVPYDPAAPQPVAYDQSGRPLYAAPPPPQPQVVHVSRAVQPIEQPVSPEVKAKHEESKRQYPSLNLSEGEYIISAVRRHPIGLFFPMTLTILLVAACASLIINYSLIAVSVPELPPFETVALLATALMLLFGIGGYVYIWIYINNKFFLTNESVIQEIQTGLFSHHEQTVSLANIEDASFILRGPIQAMFNYGSIRLSTEGDETTYRFGYVSDPKRQIAILNNAVEAFKNGRPVDGD